MQALRRNVIWLLAPLLLCMGLHASMNSGHRALVDWMQDGGAMFNISIAPSGNAVHTIKAMKRGDVLAVIPETLVHQIADHKLHYAESGLHMLWRMLNKTDELAPYWAAVPKPEDMGIGYETIPQEYGPLLECEPLAEWIFMVQRGIAETWGFVGGQLASAGGSMRLLAHALQLITSRMSRVPGERAMVPAADIAKPSNDCRNYLRKKKCPYDRSQSCIIWYAGGTLKEGDEVCNSYGWLRIDESLLRYGLMEEPAPGEAPELYMCDLPGFSMAAMGRLQRTSKPQPFKGTPKKMGAELSRLRGILAAQEANNDAAALWKPAGADPSGTMLKQLHRFRELRQAALRHAIKHLEDSLGHERGAAEHPPTLSAQHAWLLSLRDTPSLGSESIS